VAEHLDSSVLGTLQEVMEAEYPVLLDTFLVDSEERLRLLQAACRSGDAENLRQAAHSFKGSCSNMGAALLAELCREMEESARRDQLDEAPVADRAHRTRICHCAHSLSGRTPALGRACLTGIRTSADPAAGRYVAAEASLLPSWPGVCLEHLSTSPSSAERSMAVSPDLLLNIKAPTAAAKAANASPKPAPQSSRDEASSFANVYAKERQGKPAEAQGASAKPVRNKTSRRGAESGNRQGQRHRKAGNGRDRQ
jgi:histidine phosphotransfer protein HptB